MLEKFIHYGNFTISFTVNSCIFVDSYTDSEAPTFQSGLGFKNMVLQKAVLQG